jgi:colanic acid/amylovoran biosynthesis protein WcaK/AmsJ
VRILCSGGSGYGNLGDELILRGTLNGLRNAFPDSEVTVTSFSPEQTAHMHGIQLVPSLARLCMGSEDGQLRRAVRYGTAHACLFRVVRKRSHLNSVIQELYDDYDLFIQAGGGYFNVVFWRGFVFFVLELIGAIDSRVDAAVVGQTVGPFGLLGKPIARILSQIRSIYVRDSSSLERLKDLGINHVVKCADSAFLSEPTAVALPHDSKNRIVAFVAPSRFFVGKEGGHISASSNNTVIQNAVDAIGQACEAADCSVMFTTSVLDDRSWLECQNLAQKMNVRYPNVNVQTLRPTSLSDFVYAVAGSKVCISTNMHPLILATMLHVPGVAIAKNTKTLDFMNESGQGNRALTQPQLEHGSKLLRRVISDTLDLSESELSTLIRRATQAKTDALEPFSELADSLNCQ